MRSKRNAPSIHLGLVGLGGATNQILPSLRCHPDVRIVAATMFLVIRLLWMALMVYTTSVTVLVPLLHQIDQRYGPHVDIQYRQRVPGEIVIDFMRK